MAILLNRVKKPFKLPSLPPTSEDFGINLRRADHQAHIWRAALYSEPPEVDATDYGWLVGFTHRENYERACFLHFALHWGSSICGHNVANIYH